MRISDRLTAICRAAEPGESVADIGTDHGYVPYMLYRDGTAPKVIMSDVSAGSLAKAKQTFAEHETKVPEDWFRVGDGLDTIGPGEVDTVIIAGLGGRTIIDILSADPDKTRTVHRLILQPRNAAGTVRFWLFTHGFRICEEILAKEGKFVCEVISAVSGASEPTAPPYPEDDIRWAYPEMFRSCDAALLRERIGWKLSSIEEEVTNLRQSSTDQSERIRRLSADADYLRRFIE
ncbi:MAG: SAM-dependent methyltransferase [Mogibacterium sp.]|nr:SAM-dependent methyltransferase [Mogibacterium sp.]